MNGRSRQNPAYRSTQTGEIMEQNYLFDKQTQELLNRVSIAQRVYTSDKEYTIKLLEAAKENLIQCQLILDIES